MLGKTSSLPNNLNPNTRKNEQTYRIFILSGAISVSHASTVPSFRDRPSRLGTECILELRNKGPAHVGFGVSAL